MKQSRFGLLRFLSGRGRLEILTHLFAHRARHSIHDVARETRTPLSTAWVALRDMRDLGLVFLDRVGNTTLVKVNEASPLVGRLRSLADWDLPSPHVAAFEDFAKRIRSRLPKVRVELFGSVRAGTQAPSSDVDVRVIYGDTPYSREEVGRACDRASNETLDRFQIPVTPMVVKRAPGRAA